MGEGGSLQKKEAPFGSSLAVFISFFVYPILAPTPTSSFINNGII